MNLPPVIKYNFYVTLINDANLITTSTIYNFTTLGSTTPIVNNLQVNYNSPRDNIYA
ncbi:MAG: hypothetical protein KatS3mg094_583 [Candidatus Parcubacteria bacterium]|nr:MAG: hypothetical protein KatS3mg094_583 [Candidatus Parcubacteria bacterium]